MKTLEQKIRYEIKSYHGCLTGDCPHDRQEECYDEIIKHTTELVDKHWRKIAKELVESVKFSEYLTSQTRSELSKALERYYEKVGKE